MKVLLLSPYPELLVPCIHDDVTVVNDLACDATADFIISFGFKKIIREPAVSTFAGRIINVHISLLPWNRGADPNFWSWFEGTPKGVSIHLIDAGIDTGPLIAQREIRFDTDTFGETLRTSYDRLIREAVSLFGETWPSIRGGNIRVTQQPAGGSYHCRADKKLYWAQLPLGYDTPVLDIEEMGAEAAMSLQFWHKYWSEIDSLKS